jgi:Na+/H+ antiporter NhaA
LAFDDVRLQDEAKIGILVAAIAAGVIGAVVLAANDSEPG